MRILNRCLPLLLIVVLLSSCSEESNDLTLNFKLQYDGTPVVMFSEFEYPTGQKINFSKFSFYISEVSGIQNGTATEILEVDFIDLTMHNVNTEKSEEGYDYVIRDVDPSDFEELQFNIGLTPGMNSTLPAEYGSGHPLARTSEYWSAWMSYIFAKIEGNMDFDGNGNLDQGIALHLGSDAALRTVSFDLNGSDNIEIIIDLKDIFEQNGSVYDIEATPRIHSLSQLEQTNTLMDNLVQSMTAN